MSMKFPKAITVTRPTRACVAYQVTDENIFALAQLFSDEGVEYPGGTVAGIRYIGHKPSGLLVGDYPQSIVAPIGTWILFDDRGRITVVTTTELATEYEWAAEETPVYAASTFDIRTGSIDHDALIKYMKEEGEPNG